MSEREFIPLSIAILTVSDTRTGETDASGDSLERSAAEDGHNVLKRDLVKDDIYQIRAVASQWIYDRAVDVILVTGGTGFFGSDRSPEALTVLFDREIPGFGELFRARSYEEIGSSTIQSRVCAGIANRTIIFVLPGSPHACKTAWKIISEQLDSSKKSCNFVKVLKRES